jgi:hypothetical protein
LDRHNPVPNNLKGKPDNVCRKGNESYPELDRHNPVPDNLKRKPDNVCRKRNESYPELDRYNPVPDNLKRNRIMSVGKEMKAIRFRIIIMDKWVEAILIKTNLDI